MTLGPKFEEDSGIITLKIKGAGKTGVSEDLVKKIAAVLKNQTKKKNPSFLDRGQKILHHPKLRHLRSRARGTDRDLPPIGMDADSLDGHSQAEVLGSP